MNQRLQEINEQVQTLFREKREIEKEEEDKLIQEILKFEWTKECKFILCSMHPYNYSSDTAEIIIQNFPYRPKSWIQMGPNKDDIVLYSRTTGMNCDKTEYFLKVGNLGALHEFLVKHNVDLYTRFSLDKLFECVDFMRKVAKPYTGDK